MGLGWVWVVEVIFMIFDDVKTRYTRERRGSIVGKVGADC